MNSMYTGTLVWLDCKVKFSIQRFVALKKQNFTTPLFLQRSPSPELFSDLWIILKEKPKVRTVFPLIFLYQVSKLQTNLIFPKFYLLSVPILETVDQTVKILFSLSMTSNRLNLIKFCLYYKIQSPFPI